MLNIGGGRRLPLPTSLWEGTCQQKQKRQSAKRPPALINQGKTVIWAEGRSVRLARVAVRELRPPMLFGEDFADGPSDCSAPSPRPLRQTDDRYGFARLPRCCAASASVASPTGSRSRASAPRSRRFAHGPDVPSMTTVARHIRRNTSRTNSTRGRNLWQVLRKPGSAPLAESHTIAVLAPVICAAHMTSRSVGRSR